MIDSVNFERSLKQPYIDQYAIWRQIRIDALEKADVLGIRKVKSDLPCKSSLKLILNLEDIRAYQERSLEGICPPLNHCRNLAGNLFRVQARSIVCRPSFAINLLNKELA